MNNQTERQKMRGQTVEIVFVFGKKPNREFRHHIINGVRTIVSRGFNMVMLDGDGSDHIKIHVGEKDRFEVEHYLRDSHEVDIHIRGG